MSQRLLSAPRLTTSFGGLTLQSCVYNSASPAASDAPQLQALARSSAGAVTFRTSLVNGFAHDDTAHAWAPVGASSSINCYGYSPHSTAEYLAMARTAADRVYFCIFPIHLPSTCDGDTRDRSSAADPVLARHRTE